MWAPIEDNFSIFTGMTKVRQKNEKGDLFSKVRQENFLLQSPFRENVLSEGRPHFCLDLSWLNFKNFHETLISHFSQRP